MHKYALMADHHYVPQFYLRNFAAGEERNSLFALQKHGDVAVWERHSIRSMAFERDFYVHFEGDVPVCVESTLNQRVETPLSSSNTWKKIADGEAWKLDGSDKPIVYALIRHLKMRNPEMLSVITDLTERSRRGQLGEDFDLEEREMYRFLGALKGGPKVLHNWTSTNLTWAAEAYNTSAVAIFRGPVPLWTSSNPVFFMPTPSDPDLQPIRWANSHAADSSLMLPLNRHSIAVLTLGEFSGPDFLNDEVPVELARALNRQRIAQFGFFSQMRYCVCERENLIEDMDWAGYDVIRDSETKIRFRRRPGVNTDKGRTVSATKGRRASQATSPAGD